MKPLQIGITGGIGSGKSLVCRVFSCLGIPVYDADQRAKSLMNSDRLLISQIKEAFGEQSYDGSGNLDRGYLATRVFSDHVKLTQLNALVHPRVAVDYDKWVAAQVPFPYVIKEAALLFESGSYSQLDQVIVVYSPLALRLKRLQIRDPHRTSEQIIEIISRQWPDEKKTELANFVITNDEKALLIPQVIALHQEFRAFVH